MNTLERHVSGDDGVDDEQIAPKIRDPIQVILSIEGDGILRPLQVRGCGYVHHTNLSELALPLTHSEASRVSPKDQETVFYFGEAFSLGIVVLGGLFYAFFGRNASVESTYDGALLEGVLGGGPLIGEWLLQHFVEETGASRSPLGVLAISCGDKVVVRLTLLSLATLFLLFRVLGA